MVGRDKASLPVVLVNSLSSVLFTIKGPCTPELGEMVICGNMRHLHLGQSFE